MGAYENPKLTVTDPSKNLEAFERNFNKAYQAIATYRQEKAKREKAYEDAAFAVGVDMYKSIDNAEHFGKEGERAIYESTSSGTQYIMSNKLNKLEQAGLARSHKEVVDVFSKIAQGMYVTPLQLDLSHEDNDKWMELRKGLDDKENIRINMKLDDTGRQPRYVGEITYKVDGETKTVTHTELAVLLGSMQESAKQKTVKDTKLTTDIQKIIDIANAKQDKKSANEQYGTREESIQEAISENPLDLNDQQTVDFIYENKLTASEQGVMDFDNFTSVNEFKKAQVLKWLPNQLGKVKTNQPPKEPSSNYSARIARSNNAATVIYTNLQKVINNGVIEVYKLDPMHANLPSQIQELLAKPEWQEANRKKDYEQMSDLHANAIASEMNVITQNDTHKYLGRQEALEEYIYNKEADFNENNEDADVEFDRAEAITEFNNRYPRRSTGKNSLPEIFRIRETKKDGVRSYPYIISTKNIRELTEEALKVKGVGDYEIKTLDVLDSRLTSTPPLN